VAGGGAVLLLSEETVAAVAEDEDEEIDEGDMVDVSDAQPTRLPRSNAVRRPLKGEVFMEGDGKRLLRRASHGSQFV
jgi:hypothetical protein